MRAVAYAWRQAWASLWRAKVGSTFAILAIALSVVVLGALLLVTWNVERLVVQWTPDAEFSIYLTDDATSEQRGAIEGVLDRSGATQGREYVSKDQALTRFRREFAELAETADSFADNPFPASLEVRVRPEAERDGRVARLVGEIAALPGVADVSHDREWLARINATVATVRAVGLLLALIMAAAAATTVAAVVRLGLYARRDEIEIMTLVGSPLAFIRGPFIAEGLLQGGVGALIALIALGVLYGFTARWWAADIGRALGAAGLEFLPVRMSLWLVVGGMAVGGLGGLVASRGAR